MIRWMCHANIEVVDLSMTADGVSLKERRTNVELKERIGVEPMTAVARRGRLRWYGHVMRKSEDDWVKRAMKVTVEGVRPVGRPAKTWTATVSVDMKLLRINPREATDRTKWKKAIERDKSNPATLDNGL